MFFDISKGFNDEEESGAEKDKLGEA